MSEHERPDYEELEEGADRSEREKLYDRLIGVLEDWTDDLGASVEGDKTLVEVAKSRLDNGDPNVAVRLLDTAIANTQRFIDRLRTQGKEEEALEEMAQLGIYEDTKRELESLK